MAAPHPLHLLHLCTSIYTSRQLPKHLSILHLLQFGFILDAKIIMQALQRRLHNIVDDAFITYTDQPSSQDWIHLLFR